MSYGIYVNSCYTEISEISMLHVYIHVLDRASGVQGAHVVQFVMSQIYYM